MDDHSLFADKSALLRGLALGLALLVAGLVLASGAGARGWLGVSLVMSVLGAALFLRCALWLRRPGPVFAATPQGFSVMSGKSRPWYRFQGAELRRMRLGPVTLLSWVTIRVGKSRRLSRRLSLPWTHLSGSAADMAQRIREIAQQGVAGRLDDTERFRSADEDARTVPPFELVIKGREAARRTAGTRSS